MKKFSFKSIWKASYATFFLVTTVVLCVALLYLINGLTKEQIAENAVKEERLAISAILGLKEGEVLPEISWTTTEDRFVKKYASLPFNNTDCYLLNLVSAGYGGAIKITALFESNGRFVTAKVVDHTETDGIGSAITNADYFEKFKGYGVEEAIPTAKNQLKPQFVDGVSGASVSFGGVSKALANGCAFVKALSEGVQNEK